MLKLVCYLFILGLMQIAKIEYTFRRSLAEEVGKTFFQIVG